MRAIDWTRTLVIFTTIILAGVILFGLVWLLSWIGNLVLLLMLASLLTVVLMPLVDLIERRTPIPRAVAVVISYVAVFSFFAGILYLIIPPLIVQGGQLAKGLPNIFQKLAGPNSVVNQIQSKLGFSIGSSGGSGQPNLGTEAQGLVTAVLSNLALVVRDATTVAVGFVVVLVVAFYLINEGHTFRAKLDEVVPREHRGTVDFVQESVINAVAGYVRAQLAVALMVGVLAGFAAWITGVKFPLIIGALAGLLELIPFFGPTLGAIPAVLIAIFQGSWLRVGLIVGAFIIIQQIESNIVGPRIMERGVGLHPLVVIVVVLIGIEVAGIWGALFAVPGMAILFTLGKRLYRLNRDRPRPLDSAA